MIFVKWGRQNPDLNKLIFQAHGDHRPSLAMLLSYLISTSLSTADTTAYTLLANTMASDFKPQSISEALDFEVRLS